MIDTAAAVRDLGYGVVAFVSLLSFFAYILRRDDARHVESLRRDDARLTVIGEQTVLLSKQTEQLTAMTQTLLAVNQTTTHLAGIAQRMQSAVDASRSEHIQILKATTILFGLLLYFWMIWLR